MAIVDDVEFDLINKIIKRTTGAGTTVYSANALYSFAMDTFDELTHIDDTVPMSAQTPTSYTVIAGWYLQEDLTKYINGGAIQTSGYNTVITYAPVTIGTPFVVGDIGDTLTGSVSTDTGDLVDYNNTTGEVWIRMTTTADVFADTDVLSGAGTGTATVDGTPRTGETIFANPYTLGTLEGTPVIYIVQDGVTLTSWWAAGPFDIIVKVTETGTDIDSKAITVFCRAWTDLYDNFEITLTTAGQNAVPLGTSDDLNSQTAAATVLTWAAANIGGTDAVSSIDIDFEFTSPFSYDIGDGNGVQDYSVQIDCDSISLANVYEVCKWATRDGAESGYLETESDANAIDGEAYRYALSTYAEVKASPFGTFAGGKFFGARGVYFINLHADDVQNIQLVDNAGNTRSPPNFQAFSISGVVSGDRCAIFLDTGSGNGVVDKTQHTSDATANVAGDSTFETQATIESDTPTSGTLIVVATDELEEHIYRYASYATDIFTLPTATTGTGDGAASTSVLIDSGAAWVEDTNISVGDIVYDSTNSEYAYVLTVDSGTQLTMTAAKTTTWLGAAYETNSLVQTYDGSDTAYVPYIYEESTGTSISETTTIYTSDIYVLCRVRKKGILPFVTTGTYGATGYSAAAIRTTDSIQT